jgi:hypothetical protein
VSRNPYEAPRDEAPPPLEAQPTPVLGRVARAAVLFVVILTVVEMILYIAVEADLVSESVFSLSSSARIVAFLISAVIFLVWLHRAVKNLFALGRHDFPFSPGSALGWCFVPIANFVQIPKIVSAVWRASDGSDHRHPGRTWQTNPKTPFVAMWWATHLLSGLARRLAQQDPTFVNGASTLLSCIAGVSLIAIIGGIDERQAALAARAQQMV